MERVVSPQIWGHLLLFFQGSVDKFLSPMVPPKDCFLRFAVSFSPFPDRRRSPFRVLHPMFLDK